ncbi:hypothetical protein [Antarcticirhabdus aurantiaca]|uniref:Uncharacterized protein n=1 Tax=Antarcticirhabdus aurantiaca TaxID=2606717 RepID=A0ACD4NKB0_9HYPH|nr:hypothetical protein [Antarcticirhabdus aurantiaca]WAJ27279.1 hypothetical protein OXU80_20860 [Jeongeuplla avenae]
MTRLEHEIEFAPPGFRWNGQDAEGLPLIADVDGTICVPLLRFFGWSRRYKRVKISSMKPEAYVLREWWHHLHSIGRMWNDVDDRVLNEWRELQKTELNEKGRRVRNDRSVARKMEIVFTFYDRAMAATIGEFDLVSTNGPITCSEPLNISEKLARKFGLRTARTWASADKASYSTKKRATPDDSAVSVILAHLRSSAADVGLCERNWCIGRAMSDCGLRAMEVAGLTIQALEEGLAKKGIVVSQHTRALGNRPVRLDELDETDERRTHIINALRLLKRKHHENIHIPIKGKGDNEREAPFPIDYVMDLLENYIWSSRQDLIRAKSQLPPDAVFLSDSTATALGKGAIGNLMKKAFKAKNISGSGQRLRAYFGHSIASRYWSEFYAGNGFRWDQTVENMTLDMVAEALGHKSVSTTVRFYVETAMVSFFKLPGKSALPELREISKLFARHHRSLDRRHYRKIAGIVERMAAQTPGFEDVLDALLADPDYAMQDASRAVAAALQPMASPQHSLQLVPKNA